MKFFKYFIFIIITICASSAFAAVVWRTGNLPNSDASTATDSCKAFISYLNDKKDGSTYGYRTTDEDSRVCYYSIYPGGYQGTATMTVREAAECPEVGYPMYVYFDAGGKIPQQRCKAVDDKFCVFKAKPDDCFKSLW